MTGILNPELVADLRMVLDNFGRHSITSDMTIAAERLNRALFPATETAEEVKRGTIISGLIDCQVSYTLTAEEWADVQTVSNCAVQYGNIASREAAYRLAVRFPATETAKEVKPVKFPKMTAKYATANFGFPDLTEPYTRWAYKDSDGDKWVWNGDQWELHIVPPAEPDEEETKAEEHRSIIHSNRTIKTVGEALSYAETALLNTYPDSGQRAHYAEVIAELLRDVARQRPVGSNGKHGELHSPTCGCEDVPASSPVVPAPTETGPWQRIEDVPKSVYLIKDCEGDKWRRDRKSWEVYSERGFRWHPGFPDRFAPFVAAEEG